MRKSKKRAEQWPAAEVTPEEALRARILHQNNASPWYIFQSTGIPYSDMGPILSGRKFKDKNLFPMGYEPIDESTWTLK